MFIEQLSRRKDECRLTRLFLVVFFTVFLLVSGIRAATATWSRQRNGQFRAFWADAFHPGFKSPDEIDRLIADAQTSHVNALVVQIRRRGDAYYLDSWEPVTQDPDFAPNFDALRYLIDRAHAAGIEVHAWLAVIPIWNQAEPPHSSQHVFNLHGPGKAGDDYWIMKSSAGAERNSEGDFMLDPGHPAAHDYTINVAQHIVDHYDIDGLHLDRVRYFGRDWGYNPVSIRRFNERFGRTGIPASNDPNWSSWRREQMDTLIRRLYLQILASKPRVRLSVAAIAFSNAPTSESAWQLTDAYSSVFQDWRGWLEEGILDIAMPMNYDPDSNPSRAARFDGWTEWEKNHRYGRQIVIGAAAYLNDIGSSIRQARRALSPSSQGILPDGLIFYSYATTNNTQQPNGNFYRALAEPSSYDPDPIPVFAGRVGTPEAQWKTSPTRGNLMGTVTKRDGTRADGAALEIAALRGPARIVVRRISADGNGFFGAVELAPGMYEVAVTSAGGAVLVRQDNLVLAGQVAKFALRIP